MYKSLKFKAKEFDQIGFASDFHAFHRREFVWKERGFKSVEEHTEFLIRNINDNFTTHSLLFYLGDLALNSNDGEVQSFLRRLNPTIYYVFGNHESQMYRLYSNDVKAKFGEGVEVYPHTIGSITFFGMRIITAIDGQLLHLSHMAPAIWDNQNHSSWALFGHSHSNYKDALPENKQGKKLDVGVDVALKYNKNCFFTWGEIKRIMNRKNCFALDHHGENTNG